MNKRLSTKDTTTKFGGKNLEISETFSFWLNHLSWKTNTCIKQQNYIEWPQTFNPFFSNIASNLNIAKYKNFDSFAIQVNDPVLKALVQYRNHSSILGIREEGKGNSQFSVFCVEREKNQKQIRNLDNWKACRDLDNPSKIIFKNVEIFTNYFLLGFNNAIMQSKFP